MSCRTFSITVLPFFKTTSVIRLSSNLHLQLSDETGVAGVIK